MTKLKSADKISLGQSTTYSYQDTVYCYTVIGLTIIHSTEYRHSELALAGLILFQFRAIIPGALDIVGTCILYNLRKYWPALIKWNKDWLDWLTDCLTDWRADWLTDWLTKWMNEWMNAWMNEWMNEWMGFYTFMHIAQRLTWAMTSSWGCWVESWIKYSATATLPPPLMQWLPNKHKTLTQPRFNAGHLSTTLGQHWNNICWPSCVHWE